MKLFLIASRLGLSIITAHKTPSFLGISLLCVCSSIQASTTYQFTGNNYTSITDNDPPTGMYTTGMNISGSFTVPVALDMTTDGDISSLVTAYSFNDGRFTLTESNSSIFRFEVEVDVASNISTWSILVDTPGVAMGDVFSSVLVDSSLDSTFAGICPVAICGRDDLHTLEFDTAISDSPGNWSVVPIPASAWLFYSGLLGLIGIARRKKS